MANLPTLKVLLDNSTGTFPFDITSKVLATDGYSISRGRDDWQSAVTAGELGLALNNSDGRFTPGSTILATPSPIVVDQRIRVQEVVNGTTFTRFTGYVKSWPVEWPETVATFAKVRLSAVDAQARAERRPLQSMLIEEILADAPSAFYTLAEDTGSLTAGDRSGNQRPVLAITGTGTAMTFGTGTGPADGLTCATFAGGQFLRNPLAQVYVPAGSAISLECYFATSATPAATALMVSANVGVGFTGLSSYLAITGTGKLQGFPGSGGALTSAASVNDGLVHHAMLTLTAGGALTLYLDGVSVGSAAGVALPASDLIGLDIAPSDVPVITAPYVGTIAHATVYTTAPSAGRVASHAAGLNGFAGESGTARLTRVAGYAGVPVGTLDTSLTNVSAGNVDDSTAWAEIQATTDAELGVGYIDGTGSLVFHNRNQVVSKTVPDLTLSSQWVTPDVAPVNDDQQIVNYMEVTAEGTGGVSLARSILSENGDGTATHPGHGRYPGSRSYIVKTDAEALDRANWLVGKLAEPTTRYGTLTINLYAMTPVLAATVLTALDVDCWLRVTLMAPQNPGGTTADVIVQGWQETTSAETWTIQCNVVARSLFSPVWILDDPVYSVLDSTTVLYV